MANFAQNYFKAKYFSQSFLAGASSVTRLKYWTGSQWTAKPLKNWNGSSWETKTLKYWDGSSWT